MGLSTDDAQELLEIARHPPSSGTLVDRIGEVGEQLKRVLGAPHLSFFTFDRRAAHPTHEGLAVASHERDRVLPELLSTGSASLMDEALIAEYVAEVLPFDRYARALLMAPGRPQRVTRCFTSNELRRARHVYVARHLRPADVGPTIGVHLPLTADLWLAVSFARGRGAKDFSPDADRVLELVQGEIAAVALGGVLDEAARRLTTEVAPVMCGFLVFGRDGALVQASPGATRLAALVHEPGVHGATAIALAARRLASSAERAAHHTFLTEGEGCLELCLSRMPGRPPGSDTVLALLEVVPPEAADHLKAIMKRAGLTPRESAVAELTCRGLGVREVAREVRVSPTTVKTHLRRVYAKTGTRSQAELAAQLLRADGPRLPSNLDRSTSHRHARHK